MTCVQLAQASKRQLTKAQQLESVEFTDQLLLLRHGERLDHVDRAWRTTSLLPETDPPLSAAGRRQALETGLMFFRKRKHGKVRQRALGMISLLLFSPFHRCVETALIVNIVGFDGKLAMFVDPLLSEWHSTKLFSRPPRLGGRYIFTTDTINFRPHWETLCASLGTFFRSAGGVTEDGIDEVMATRWLSVLEARCVQKPSFLVWTSASMRQSLHRNACAQGGGAVHRVLGGTSGDLTGINYPENTTHMLRRVGEAIQVRFDAKEGKAAGVPICVREAEVQEAKHLPRRFVHRSVMGSAITTAREESAMLLPPARIMMVTHAEAVALAVKHCCPRYHSLDSRVSVPYCSLTSLMRVNDYYRALDDEALAARRPRKESEKSWSVTMAGSTDHLQTPIFLHYS
ncbi:hypothetical protein TraAM80_03163 [Trypanosoma rangeli]|uniref:Uncharacterized protein n=1 Tax=Trypanosoma rangeli TaxID=5698 RepID=A0A3R7KJL2_TRYRA|nr:uncharacterized protein TraAM80_03163 [Trypanosoma rangeli]RNF07789.1 hypothetical protein TraAM80_03163 [Trypanosoma rangeli]|eukprot:RNF07789.1 hypothetical protein TraAM80_03163 [Trypanosoma rangeli]